MPHGPGGGLAVTTGLRGNWIIVEVSGDLDLSSAHRLEAEVEAALELVDEPRLALDLAGLEFCDSTGLAAFVHLWQHVVQRSGEFVLLRPRPYLRQWLEITGLHPRISVRDSLSDEETGLADLNK
jgi:anti-sigma B factor antagonist